MERELLEKMILYVVQCVLGKTGLQLVGLPGYSDTCPHLVLEKNEQLYFMLVTLTEEIQQRNDLISCARNFHAIPCIAHLKHSESNALFGLQMHCLEIIN